MTRKRTLAGFMFVPAAVAVVGLAQPALAIPSFARKYGTSCLTCHTVYPKLNPFGEAFRRNGYRFPGNDSDFVKQDTVALGQEAYKKTFPNAVWPGTLPASVPLAIGFNGQALIHPAKNATAALADHGAQFSMSDLVEEAHLWAGGSFDNTNTFFGELTFSGGGADIEHALLLFNDLVGPPHAVNLVVGKGMATLSSFGGHSSYLADMQIPMVMTSNLAGAPGDAFSVMDNYDGAEVNGVVMGCLDYSLGMRAGVNNEFTQGDENTYAHIGMKFGGLRMDGEGGGGPADPMKPWAETALAVEGFAYHSRSLFTYSGAPSGYADYNHDVALTAGAGIRLELGSLELDSGLYQERHSHLFADGSEGLLLVQYNELSYVLYPWLVPAVRLERYDFNQGHVGPVVHNVRIVPGVAFLVRPNLKLVLAGDIESADGVPMGGGAMGGMPMGGWGAANGVIQPTDKPVTEFDALTATLAAAF